MAPPTQSDKSEDFKLMAAILKDLDKEGKIKSLDWVTISQELGVDKLNTVQKRWGTLKKKEGFPSAAAGTPKKRAAPGTAKGSASKKAKTITPIKRKKNQATVETDDEEDSEQWNGGDGDAAEDSDAGEV